MQLGNLVIYDETGKIYLETGESEGSVLEHTYPVGIPYIEIPFGTMATRRLVGIDVTKTPHEPIFEIIEQEPTTQEQIEQLENELLIARGII